MSGQAYLKLVAKINCQNVVSEVKVTENTVVVIL